MNLLELQILLQSVSSFAIAGGLVYTAFQFRHARKAQHAANFTKLVEMQMHLREMRVKDPDLAQVFRDDVEGLTSDKDIRAYFFALMQLSVYEIVWFSHRQGLIPDDYYQSWAERMKVIAAEPVFRAMLKSPSMKIMHDEFQRYVSRLVETIPERPASKD